MLRVRAAGTLREGLRRGYVGVWERKGRGIGDVAWMPFREMLRELLKS